MSYKSRQGSENLEWGREAEKIAAEYLRKEGYMVREQNWKFGNRIEIDIIAETEGTIVFVEVKARRGDVQRPDEAVDVRKRQMMVKGGDIYLRTLKHMHPFRLDVITVTGSPASYTIRHLPDAFLPDLS